LFFRQAAVSLVGDPPGRSVCAQDQNVRATKDMATIDPMPIDTADRNEISFPDLCMRVQSDHDSGCFNADRATATASRQMVSSCAMTMLWKFRCKMRPAEALAAFRSLQSS
jgi:hypothetical protein